MDISSSRIITLLRQTFNRMEYYELTTLGPHNPSAWLNLKRDLLMLLGTRSSSTKSTSCLVAEASFLCWVLVLAKKICKEGHTSSTYSLVILTNVICYSSLHSRLVQVEETCFWADICVYRRVELVTRSGEFWNLSLAKLTVSFSNTYLLFTSNICRCHLISGHKRLWIVLSTVCSCACLFLQKGWLMMSIWLTSMSQKWLQKL